MAVDTFTWDKVEAALFIVGTLYLLLFAKVSYEVAQQQIVSLSHRFRYVIFLVGMVFVRCLCSFIGMSESQYAQHHTNSILPFFLFDVGQLVFLATVLALVGAQIRNSLSCDELVTKGIIVRTGSGPSNTEDRYQPLGSEANTGNTSSSSQTSRYSKPTSWAMIHTIGLIVYFLVALMVIAYGCLSFTLYASKEAARYRNRKEQIFFIVVNTICMSFLAYSTRQEYHSGCLKIEENADSNSSAAFLINYRKPSDYSYQQMKISWAMLALLFLRVVWSAYQIITDKSNEFENHWYLILVEYMVEIFILSSIFYWLLGEKLVLRNRRHPTIHGAYDEKDPYFILSLLRKFSPASSQSLTITLRMSYEDGGQADHFIKIKDLLRIVASTEEGLDVFPDSTQDEPGETENESTIDRLSGQVHNIERAMMGQNAYLQRIATNVEVGLKQQSRRLRYTGPNVNATINDVGQ